MRARPPILRALGRSEPPPSVVVDDRVYRLREIYKHDSWAATARYGGSDVDSGSDVDIVCKFNRVQPVFLLPMGWLGSWLAKRERTAYQRLTDLSGIAQGCGPVYAEDRWLRHAVAHQFVSGRPLKFDEVIGDDFFPRLLKLLKRVHEVGYAYVDLHKRENIIVGDDGQPYLIDFQISYCQRWNLATRVFCGRWLLKMLQASDLFCLAKHVRHFRPDQISELGLERFLRVPWWIQLHRLVAVPFRQLRRRLLSQLAVRDRSGRVSSEVFTEHALRD